MRVTVSSAILFLSGASALLFETLWLRLSGLAFGNSVWSAALILSSFMAGLALGSAIVALTNLGRVRPLLVYATLEVVVAIGGCTLAFALPLLGEWLGPLFRALWSHHGLLEITRLTVSFAVLLIPTTAMGMSLPVVLEAPLVKGEAFPRSVGLLYGSNTLGAMTGALLGEAYLIEAFGILGTALTAAGLSLVAAVVAWTLTQLAPAAENNDAPMWNVRLSFSRGLPWRLLAVSAGAGATFLGLEVIWTRFLRLYVASSSIAFAVMLAVVLAGLGLGSLASTQLPSRMQRARTLPPLLLLLAAIATLLSYIFFPMPNAATNFPAANAVFAGRVAQASCALMLPVALLSGALLPLLVTGVGEGGGTRMNNAGLTILFNTVGAAIGPLVAAFILLPRLGFQSSLIVLATAYAGLALFLVDKRSWSFRSITGRATLLLAGAFAIVVVLFPYDRAELHFANARRPYEEDGSVLIKKVEGTADTLQLLRRDLFGEPYYYRLVTNSYSMSGTLPRSQRYMRLFAYLPLALRPQSENALLVGYGVGVTADAFTRDPRLKKVDIVDISKEVFDLAELYAGTGYSNPLRDPRVTTYVQDGRFFLQAAPEHYDIITGEPPPLKTAGTVNLYTEQFFSLMNGRLKGGGIASFWLPIYQLTTTETKAVLRAFLNVFPNASIWANSDLEWVMIGIRPPVSQPDEEAARRLWIDAKTAADLTSIGIESPDQLSSLFVMDAAEIDRFTRGVEPVNDLYPKRLGDAPPNQTAAYELGYHYLEHTSALQRFESSAFIREIWPREWSNALESLFFVREARYRSEMTGTNWLAELDFYLRESRLREPVLAVQNSDEVRVALAKQLQVDSRQLRPEAAHDLIADAIARRDFATAIEWLEAERDRNFPNSNDFFLLIYLYCHNGKVAQAEQLAQARATSTRRDWFVDWLWGELQAEFGFRPPAS